MLKVVNEDPNEKIFEEAERAQFKIFQLAQEINTILFCVNVEFEQECVCAVARNLERTSKQIMEIALVSETQILNLKKEYLKLKKD